MAEQFKPFAGEEKQSSTLLSRAPERAILVGVDMPGVDWPVEESLDELAQLAETAGVVCVDGSFSAWHVLTPVHYWDRGKYRKLPTWYNFTPAMPFSLT